jgi:transcriptional regulator
MYIPKHFNAVDDNKVFKIIEDFPFATVMSFDENTQPFFSHIPLITNKTSSGFSLLGHVSKQNSQWKHFQANRNVKVIVQGPHTYVTPRWYKSGRDVPTWNYVAIHIEGRAKLIEQFDDLVVLLKKLTSKFEPQTKEAWEFEIPSDLLAPAALEAAIVGFEIEITKIEAKFKLSQNRSTADKLGVIEGLSQRTDEMSKQIRKLMLEQS